MFKIRTYLLSLWKLIDPVYYTFSRLSYVDKADRKNRVFRVRLVRYRGRSLTLTDGSCIHKNDLMLKIHLHNVRLLKDMYKLDSEFRKGLYIYTQIKRALPKLAIFIENHERKNDIKGIVGITMLNQGSERIGFDTHTILNRYYFCYKYVMQYPIYLLSSVHPFKNRRNRPVPKYLIMSKKRLLEQYGSPLPDNKASVEI